METHAFLGPLDSRMTSCAASSPVSVDVEQLLKLDYDNQRLIAPAIRKKKSNNVSRP